MSKKVFVDNVQSPLIQRRSEKELQGLPLSSVKLFTDEGFQFQALPTLWLAVLQEVLVVFVELEALNDVLRLDSFVFSSFQDLLERI
jgi:hypothetical protein